MKTAIADCPPAPPLRATQPEAHTGLLRSYETRTWTAFWQATVESRATAEVAAELGITPNAVRLAKSHVLRRLREEMGELIA